MGEMVMAEYLKVFKNKRVLVTGHTGFKGSWLTFLLKEIGAEVLGYALAPTYKNSHFELLDLQHIIQHVEADIRDVAKLKSVMNDFQPEIVFHLAAQALVHKSYLEPEVTFNTNVMGSVNLLEAVRECESVKALVYITSDKCYENLEWIWGYRENDRLGGHDPYSASKASAELVFSAYARSFFYERKYFGAVTARAGNVIGGGDWAEDRIIPDCIRAIQAGQPISLRKPNATRPWQHVLEPISGYLLLASKLMENPKNYTGSSWNFGPSSQEIRTVLEITRYMVNYFGQGTITCEANKTKHEAQLLQLNCDKAHQLLEWYPRWKVDKTLHATAQWYKEVNDGANVKDVTRKQIQDYFEDAL